MSDIEKWVKNDGLYRFDYIGQKVYEGKYYYLGKNGAGCYREVLKTGCVYAFPKPIRVIENNIISNCVTRDNEPIRIRKFDNFYVLEPAGIIVSKDNVTFVSSANKEKYDKTYELISFENTLEACNVSFNAFFGKYCESAGLGTRIAEFDFDRTRKLILDNIKNHNQSFDNACVFCYYLLKNGLNKIDLDVLKIYTYGLGKSLVDNTEFYERRKEFIIQFISLLYFGVLYSDYENINKLLSRPKLDRYDPINDEIYGHLEESVGNQFSDLIIDDSEVVKNYLSDKYEKNKDRCQAAEYFAQAYISFYERFIKELKEKELKK